MRSSCALCLPYRAFGNSFALSAAIVSVAFFQTSARAQTAPAVDASFDALVKQVAASSDITPAEHSRRFVDWMAANDWRSLSPANELALVEGLEKDSPQQGKAESAFSVRWTGFVTAPVDGTYRLSQLRNYLHQYGLRFYADGVMKVWLNDELVLDTTPASTEAAFALGGDETRFESRPVVLSAGKAAGLRVEFSFSRANWPPAYEKANSRFRVQNVQAVLMWSAADRPREIIPESAYSPPAESATPEAHGLKAEYFSDAAFKTRAFDRTDPGVTLISTAAPLLAAHHTERAAVLAHVRERVCDPGFLGRLTREDIEGLWRDRAFSRFMARLFAPQRIEFIEQLLEQPRVFTNVDPYRLGWLFHGIARLPGDFRVRTLDVWGAAVKAPVRWPGVQQHFHLGPLLSWYGYIKYDNFGWIGGSLTGPYAADLKKLVTEHLENPDRSCRFVLAWVAAAAAIQLDGQDGATEDRATEPQQAPAPSSPPLQAGAGGGASPAPRSSSISWLREFLDKRLADESLTGDARATWLFARADVEEFFGGEPLLRPQFGLPWLDQAQLVAESDALKFQIQIARADRLLSIGNYTDARKLVDDSAAKFTGAEVQTIVARWRQDAEALEKLRPAWDEQQVAKKSKAAETTYTRTLKQRRDKARERGDTASVERYEQLIQQASPKP